MVHIAKWKMVAILLICLAGIIFALPNMFDDKKLDTFPNWFPKKQINLGLDLQGGSSILLEVDVNNVVKEHYGAIASSLRKDLRAKKIGYLNLKAASDKVSFTLRNPGDEQTARKIIRSAAPDTDILVVNDEVSIILTEPALIEMKKTSIKQSIEIIRRRVDETGTLDPSIQRQGDDRILLQVPGLSDPRRVKELLGKTVKMSFHLGNESVSVSDARAGRLPSDSVLLPYEDRQQGLSSYVIFKEALVTGDMLIDARPGNDQNGRPAVTFKLKSIGAKKFGEATAANVGRPFAIVLDNKVISVANINEPIYGGNVQITGSYTVQEASDMSLLLRAGALPAKLTPLEERTVGPELGADSVKAGEYATVYSIVFIAVFMLLAYSLFGFFANISLALNLTMLVAALSALQATLTLPGIAGIALTLGMAVDANVLIYERIREEVRNGKNPLGAIDIGFTSAMRTIIDSNVTTLIGAALLFQFGTGPIRGFAVTLTLGIVISMFTAITLTRLIVVQWYKWQKPKTLPL